LRKPFPWLYPGFDEDESMANVKYKDISPLTLIASTTLSTRFLLSNSLRTTAVSTRNFGLDIYLILNMRITTFTILAVATTIAVAKPLTVRQGKLPGICLMICYPEEPDCGVTGVSVNFNTRRQ
jgi:hypothetical protein